MSKPRRRTARSSTSTRVLSSDAIDRLVGALAVMFRERGVDRGDVVRISLQHVSQFALALLPLWKIGASSVLLNPM